MPAACVSARVWELASTRAEIAFVLAGGLGTRLGPLTSRVPKSMLPVAGRPFLEILIEQLAHRGTDRAVLCIGHLGDVVVQHFGDGARWGIRIEYSRESGPLGTAGALRAATAARPGPYLVLNGDSFVPVDLRRLVSAHHSSLDADPATLGTLVLARMADADQYGRVSIDEAGRIVAFDEKHSGGEGEALVSAGVYVIENAVLSGVAEGTPSSLERDVFPSLVGRLRSFVIDRPFLDIGTPDRYARAQRELAAPRP